MNVWKVVQMAILPRLIHVFNVMILALSVTLLDPKAALPAQALSIFI
jgi:hypothetical protein